MKDARPGSFLLSTIEGLHGVRNLATTALGLEGLLGRVVAALEVSSPRTPVLNRAWLDVALGVVSLRRTLTGVLASATSGTADPSPSPAPARSSPGKLLR